MNKSLVFKNKFYLFCILLSSFFLFFYLTFILIYGERGIISYFKISNKNLFLNEKLNNMTLENKKLEKNISRLKTDSLDLDYLDEQIRLKSGFHSENEIVITIEE
tara:strand:- start:262 stop:576 length:315 start_codon:yes stop_codon:yes gene_type:complete